MKNLFVLLILIFVLTNFAGAVNNYFQPAGGEGNWDDPCNWSLKRVPDFFTNTDDVFLTDSYICNVNSVVPYVKHLDCGYDGDATLNIYDGAFLYIVDGIMFGYASGNVRVNMYGGEFADSGIPGDTGGWSGFGWNANFKWHQEAGHCQFYVNHGYAPTDCEVFGGELILEYMPINNDTEDYWVFYVAGGGVIQMDAVGGLQAFTVGICGTMKIKDTYWSEFESRAVYLGTPHITTEGNYKVVYVTADVDFNQDCEVDFSDYTFLVSKWLDQSCVPDDWCEGADVDQSGSVDSNDLYSLTQKWLNPSEGVGLANSLYVATDGNDNNPGTEAEPFRTLEKARDTIRYSGVLPEGGVTVYLRGGKYFHDSEFKLASQDSGEPNKPITYRSSAGETARIIGGSELEPSWFTYTDSSSPVWSRLDVSAQGNVMECNLGDHGITNWGEVRSRGYGGNGPSHMELSFDQEIMQLARWPNTGFETYAMGATGSDRIFIYSGTRKSRWLTAEHPIAFGYWKYDWAGQYIEMTDINTVTNKITLAQAPPYGFKFNGRWFATNLIEELDIPGEYYVNYENGMLYFWPPSDINNGELLVSVLGENEESIVEITGVENLTISDITFEVCRNNAFDITDCEDVLIDNCIIRNTGNGAFIVTDGSNVDVQNCDVYGIGSTAFKLTGGDRLTLTNSGHTVQNNAIHDFGRWVKTIAVGVWFYGCGNEVFNNHFYHAPQSAIISFSYNGGNNHVIRFNEFNDICYEADDSGVVTMAQDWGFRGNEFEYNVIHDIQSNAPTWAGVHGIYLDAAFSSLRIFGNVFYNIENVAINNNGGRDNDIQNNVIAYCKNAHTASRAGRCILNLTPGNYYNYKEKIEAMNYDQPPWSTAYPELAAIFDGGYDAALDPGGNIIARNIGYQNTQWMRDTCYCMCNAFDYYTIFWNDENNDPLFVDEANNNFALKDNSPAYAISGFSRIPFERIGILDQNKATRPNPSNDKTGVSTTPTLYWAEAFQSTSRDIYFGSTFADVNDANTFSTEFKINTTSYEYSPSGLSTGSTYYWRIDERNADGVMGKGDVWSFTTTP